MPSYTIGEAGDYLLWAAPLDEHGSVAVKVECPNGSTHELKRWSAAAPVGDPAAGPAAHIGADAGCTYSTVPEHAWLIVRRMQAMAVAYDSHETSHAPA